MSKHETTLRELYPLAPVYPFDDSVTLRSRLQTHEDGYSVAVSPLLNRIRDVTMNKKTLLMLTDTQQLSSIFDISSRSLSVDNLYFKSSLYTTDTSHYFIRLDRDTNKLYVDTFHAGNDTFFLFRSVPYPFSYQTEPTMQLWISRPLQQSTKTGLLTVSRSYPYELTIQDPIWSDAFFQQHFDYFVTGNTIQFRSKVINMSGEIVQVFISYDRDDDSRLKLIGDSSHNYDFMFQSPDNTQQFNTTNYDGTIYWIKYHNDFVNQEDNKSVEIDPDTSIRGVPVNLLCSSPYETLEVISGDAGQVSTNLNVLKNFQTPEYEYTDNSFFVSHYRIEGKVTVYNHVSSGPDLDTEDFIPLANVVLKGFPTTVVTDASGNYSVLVNYDFSNAVYPDEPNYFWGPSALDIFNLDQDINQNFLGSVRTIPVTGIVTDNADVPLSGVNVITSSEIDAVMTDLSGNYIVNVPWNWNGVVTLSASYVTTFTPPSSHLINVTDVVGQNFAEN